MSTKAADRSAKEDEGVWEGICIDDGTGLNVFYLASDGKTKLDSLPEGFSSCRVERLETDEQRFYYRGLCTRCGKKGGPVVLSLGSHLKVFSLNLCEACVLTTTPGISRLRGHGDEVWANNIDTPKNFYADLIKQSVSEKRNSNLLCRAIEAKYYLSRESKTRRNNDRKLLVMSRAADRNVKKGQVACWGSNEVFDEYFGKLNSGGEPEGYGVMFYSDGSTYCGGWRDGLWHISDGTTMGQWKSTLETMYEGTFLFGLKHGRGKQTFIDGSYYEGEFAKGFEHGSGRIVYPDGTTFTGKFRFGRKDGPGELVTRERLMLEKGVFRDTGMPFQDAYPPVVEELHYTDVQSIQSTGTTSLFDPESLLDLCCRAVSRNLQEPKTHGQSDVNPTRGGGFGKKALRKNGTILPYDCARLIPNYLKQRLSVCYVDESSVDKGIGSPEFRQFLLNTDIGFTLMDELDCGGVKMESADVAVLAVIQGANRPLKSLKLVSTKLGAVAINNLMNHLQARLWPDLQKLDLSFNLMEMSSLKSIFDTLPFVYSLREIKLAGCGIRPAGAAVIASFLSTNDFVETLDLAFNVVEANGAEALARALETGNNTLKSLSLRRNNIGMAGGEAFIRVLKNNGNIEQLCLADNQIGPDLSSAIGGRLHSSVGKVLKSTCADQLRIPPKYLKLLERAKHSH